MDDRKIFCPKALIIDLVTNTNILLVALSYTFCLCGTRYSQATNIEWGSLAQHPRLFVSTQRWDEVKNLIEADEVSGMLYSVVQKTALQLLDKPPVDFIDTGAYWHGPMRQAQGRIIALAMMYRLTKDRRFLDRATLEMQKLADLPNWYPQHFLDTAEGALGMAIGLDWLHDDLTDKQRNHFANALANKALRESLDIAEENTWVSGRNNWTAVCHGGLVVGALAIAEREPVLAKQIIERALINMPGYAELYAPAGAYSEGPDYWAYGTTFYALMAEALQTSLGSSYAMENAKGFLKTAEYTLQMTAPSGRLFNFADNSSTIGLEPIMFWFARELHQDDLVNREIGMLNSLRKSIIEGSPRGDASRMLPLALLWRESNAKSEPASARPLKWWSEGGSQPQAVQRTSWNDPQAAFVGIKAGTANDSHAHMDIGSFVFESQGVRWAVDLGRESYPHARANGIKNTELFDTKQQSKRWAIFRCGPESHNILRFNNAWQQVDGKAEIAPTDDGFSVDLTPVVNDQVISAKRQFTLHSDRSLTIRDSWITGSDPVDVSWQWLTHADVVTRTDGFVLSQSGNSLHISASAKSDLSYIVEDVSAPKNKFDSPNPKLTRMKIHLKTPASMSETLQVTASEK